MNKSNMASFISKLLFLVVFNVIFFMAGGTDRPASVWISYAFIHFAYFALIVTPFFTSSGKSSALSGMTLGSISTVYFAIELCFGVLVIFLHPERFKFIFFVQLIVAAVYVFMFLSMVRANETTAQNETIHDMQVSFIKSTASRMKLLVDTLDDKAANKEIENAYDFVHSSPTKSIGAVKALEAQVVMQVSELERAVSMKDTQAAVNTSRNIVALMQERNRQVNLG